MNNKTSNIYPWVVVGLLWGVALLNYMDRQMLSTMRIPMMEDVRELESAANFGRLMAVFLWVYGLMSPLSGIIGDRVNRKWLIVGSLCVWSGVTYLMGYATTFNQLYWLRGIMGVSEALYLPAALSLIADFHKDKTRSLAVGIHMTGLYVGQAIGGFGATFAAIYSWHTTFHWFGIIGIGYGIILAFFLRDKERGNVLCNIDVRCRGKCANHPAVPSDKPPFLQCFLLSCPGDGWRNCRKRNYNGTPGFPGGNFLVITGLVLFSLHQSGLVFAATRCVRRMRIQPQNAHNPSLPVGNRFLRARNGR